jgi:16S rRNA (cytosine967-C5)-methyltransferase
VEKPREIAVQVLLERQKGEYIESLLDFALKKHALKSEDRGFLQELVYGVVRWEFTLDWLIGQKTGGKPQKEMVQILLRLALYQMFWLERVPSYAAVNETVEICKSNGLHAQAKFVNALLRGYDRERAATQQRLLDLKSTKPALGYSHPEWLWRRWEMEWGSQRTTRLLDWNNSPPPVFARVNTLKTTAEKLLKTWNEEGVKAQPVHLDWISEEIVFRLEGYPSLARLRSFMDGFFYVQDPSTLLAPTLLDARTGDSILDLCAAPGGKTTFIAQLIQNEGRVVAEDIDRGRLKMVEENARRLGATCVSIEASGDRGAGFDRVLVDAPCSNTGVMRRRVELRWRIQPEEIKRLAQTQLGLLQAAARRVREGGVLLYSTCSLERDENQSVVGKFLAENNTFTLNHERALTPMNDGFDGAYCARMLRRA